MGIGPLPANWELVSYVLSDIPQDQQKEMFEAFSRAADAVEKTLRDGIEAVMNQANQKKERHVSE